MRGLIAIYRKEMGHYFVSPIAYAVSGAFLLIMGIYFNRVLAVLIEQALRAGMQAMQYGQMPEMDIPSRVLRASFDFMGLLLYFMVPMLTMDMYPDEKRRGTMELLMTSPLRELDIVLGKFCATFTFFTIMLLPTALCQVAMFVASEPRPPWRLLLTGYLGVLLLGAVLIALGSFLSSLTENQIIAAVLTFIAILIFVMLDFLASGSSSALGEVLQYCSIMRHFDDFTRGVIDTSSLVFYVSLVGLFLLLTQRSVDALRWRRA